MGTIKKGFTLIEVLVSLIVIGVAFFSIIFSIIYIRQRNELNDQINVASRDLYTLLEDMRAIADIVPKFPDDFLSVFPPGTPLPLKDPFNNLPGQEVTVHYKNPAANPLELSVVVRWNELGKERVREIAIPTIMTARRFS